MTNNILTIKYEGEDLKIEIISEDNDLKYKVNFEHPIYIEKELDDEGVEYWLEIGVGETLRAKEIGEEIENHPDFI
jgi:hypothetical protein